MTDVHERPKGANNTDPHRTRRPGKPSNPHRWSMLGLADSAPVGALYADAGVADLLMWGLVAPGSTDPIEGVLDAVCMELRALVDMHESRPAADVLHMCSRRIEVAMKMLRWCENREKMSSDTKMEGVSRSCGQED